ncbi:MAG: hypothetical protein HY791_26615 [Deltaproteobacteria bacterium]|nr:hypothetical protein [Deltaproteobacteria bacterium]
MHELRQARARIPIDLLKLLESSEMLADEFVKKGAFGLPSRIRNFGGRHAERLSEGRSRGFMLEIQIKRSNIGTNPKSTVRNPSPNGES